MFCGTGSFKHVDEDPAASGRDSPNPRKKHGSSRVNPYAARGLDKFSTVLSELEARRDRILRRVGSDCGPVMVRFVQSNGSWAPIVVKLPDEQQLKDADALKKPKTSTASASTVQPVPAAASSSTPLFDPASPRVDGARKNDAARATAPAVRTPAVPFSRGKMLRPGCYWPAAMILTLVSLAVFGRVFAICCISIWWYLMPTLSSSCSSTAGEDAHHARLRRSMEKRKQLPYAPPQQQEPNKGSVMQEAVRSPRSHVPKGRNNIHTEKKLYSFILGHV